MAYELVYTSAERGLRPGTRGFCTVAHTRGIQPQMIQLLEALSAYKSPFGTMSTQDAPAPVAWSHLTGNLLGHSSSVISRVCATDPDHTGRSNKLAHHVLVQARERCAGGPAWLCQQENFLLDVWNDQPHIIDAQKAIPEGDCENLRATAWEALTGDAGYAAFLAEAFRASPDGIAVLAFKPGMDMLPLIAESLALVEPSLRWRVTFSTYFTSLPAGATCGWRCCVAGSDAFREASRNPKAVVLNLTESLPPAPTGALADLARRGRIVVERKADPAAPEHSAKKFVLMNNRNINMLNLKPRRMD